MHGNSPGAEMSEGDGAAHEGRSGLVLTAEIELLSCRRVFDVALIEAGKKPSCFHVTVAVCRFGRKDPCYCAALAYCCSQCCRLVHRWRKVFRWHGKRSAPLESWFYAPSLLSFGLPSYFSIFSVMSCC